jgi:phosphotransferase system enzyme I (PtsI)
MPEKILKGIAVSSGIAIGRAQILQKQEIPIVQKRLSPNQAKKEKQRFFKALEKSKNQLIILRRKILNEIGEALAYIFDAHISILEDKTLIKQVEMVIEKEQANADWAVKTVMDRMIKIFDAFDDAYLKDRIADIKDICRRILKNLTNAGTESKIPLQEEAILVAPELSPSRLAQMSNQYILGFATEAGGRDSHTAILARSLHIPAVAGLHNLCQMIEDKEQIIIDGDEGILILNPDISIINEYKNKQLRYKNLEKQLLKTKDLESKTIDGVTIELQANIEMPDEVEPAIKYGAKGIGLYRTEFLFLKPHFYLPGEEEQLKTYRSIAHKLKPYPVMIRTLDLGGEKINPSPYGRSEPNPVLGLRAVRYCMNNREVFSTQLRALLQAACYGNIKIIIPMISGVEEFRQVKSLVKETQEELKQQKLPYGEKVPLGVMIEVPSAAAIADLLAREADFFTIGTNDLIQYFLAVDRTNAQVSHLFQPLHPAILRSLKFIIDSANKEGIEVGLCGEMASDPLFIIILLGLGLRQLSMNPASIPKIKGMIRTLNYSQAKTIAVKMLELSTAREVEEYALEKMASLFPDGFLAGIENKIVN